MSHRHGTYAAYESSGCRCDQCVEYQRARVARNRAARLASGAISHGKRSGYDAGCRCDACVAKSSEAWAIYYARRKDAS